MVENFKRDCVTTIIKCPDCGKQALVSLKTEVIFPSLPEGSYYGPIINPMYKRQVEVKWAEGFLDASVVLTEEKGK